MCPRRGWTRARLKEDVDDADHHDAGACGFACRIDRRRRSLRPGTGRAPPPGSQPIELTSYGVASNRDTRRSTRGLGAFSTSVSDNVVRINATYATRAQNATKLDTPGTAR